MKRSVVAAARSLFPFLSMAGRAFACLTWAGGLRGPAAARLATGLAATLLAVALPSLAGASEYVFSWRLPTPQGNALGGCDFESPSTGYAVGPRGTVIVTTDGGVSWQRRDLYPGFAADLEDVLVLGPGQLLAVGSSPGIFRSTDGGASWTAVPNPSTARLTDIEVVAGGTLSIVGTAGQILRSTDAGDTWTMLASPGAHDLHEQHWRSPTDGTIVGLFCARRTTNGGQTWLALNGIEESLENFNEVFFTDTQNGTILSDFKMWRTTNGGGFWSGDFANPVVYMGNTVVLGPQRFQVSTNLEGAFVWETTNGGETWTDRLLSGAGGFLDFDRLADGALVAVSTEGDVFRSTDEGLTWANATYSAFEDQRGVIGAIGIGPAGLGAAGTTGVPPTYWYRTPDGGATWLPQPGGPNIAFTEAISYWDDAHAIAAGDVGRMWRTTDGGVSWIPVSLPTPPVNGSGHRMSLPSAGVAFVSVWAQTQSTVFRTTDYGATWEARGAGLPPSAFLSGISFLNASVGFVASSENGMPRIYKTTNAGASWSSLGAAGIPSFTSDMHWTDAQTGMATVYLSPGGIFRTTNGGVSWLNVWPIPSTRLSFAPDGLHGGAIPDDFSVNGTIYVTEDGGASWSLLELPATTAGSSITATSDGFWVGGTAGVILKVTRVDPAAAGDGALVPDGPSANDGVAFLRARGSATGRIAIDYQLVEPAAVDLAILDVGGRRVAILDRGDRSAAATVTAYWDGSGSASGGASGGGRAADGVYFARLATTRGARAVKVILRR